MAKSFDESLILALALRNRGGSGTTNYNDLENKPKIEGKTLQGNVSLSDIGYEDATDDEFATEVLDKIWAE